MTRGLESTPKSRVRESLSDWWNQPLREKLTDLLVLLVMTVAIGVSVVVWRTAIAPPYDIRVILPTATRTTTIVVTAPPSPQATPDKTPTTKATPVKTPKP